MSAEALHDRSDVGCAATSAEALGRVRERVSDAIVVDDLLNNPNPFVAIPFFWVSDPHGGLLTRGLQTEAT